MSGQNKKESPFPAWLSFILDNPIRRRFDPPEKIIQKFGIDKTSIVMDFGCGPGYYTIPFAKTAGHVVAVDVQPKMLEKVSKKALREGVTIQTLQSDGKQIALPNSTIDLIFLNHVYHEVQEKPRVLLELRRLLRPCGRLAIQESTRKLLASFLGPPAMNPREIAQEMGTAGFPRVETVNMKNRSLVIGTT